MALILDLSCVERNDNTALIIRDTTGTDTDTTGWGYSSNTDFTEIHATGNNTTYSLNLVITITGSDNVEVEYDPIDLYSEFGPFTLYTSLTFTIDPSYLLVDGVPQFVAGDLLPDGVYTFAYTLVDEQDDANNITTTKKFLINGQVQTGTYDLLREVTTNYDLQLTTFDRKTKDAMFAYNYLVAMKASEYEAKWEECINQLFTLERIVRNGSNLSW